MKKIILILILLGDMVFANSFIDAITSGNKEGDINLIFDFYHANPNNNEEIQYKKSSYLATSFGLYYQSAFYGYFRMNIGFRGALPIIQGWKKLDFNYGRGSISRDFDQNNKAILSRSYIEYFDGDTSIKAGRIENESELFDNQLDGVWIQNKSLGFLLIDLVWANQYGTAIDREIEAFNKVKDYIGGNAANSRNDRYGGAYYLALNFDILKDMLAVKLYGSTTPELYSFIGISSYITLPYFSASTSFANGFEHEYSDFKGSNSYIFDINAKVDINIFYGKLGYIKTSKDSGIGSMTHTGNTFSPFFYYSGDALNEHRDVNLIYATLGIASDIVNTYVVYGFNIFRLNESIDNTKYKQGELNLSLDWKIADNTNLMIYYINTHGAKLAIPNVNRVGTILKLSF